MKRKVLVHVGPHKTGSTAIQTVLMESGSSLAEAGIQFMHDKLTHETALYFSQGEFEAAQDNLAVLAKQISESQFDRIILSQEDFCGDLPGRTRSNRVYPNFTKILRAIERGLRPHEVTFVFFERDEVEWLTSCYHQHLRYRTLFCDIHDFFDHFQGFKSWEDFFDWPRNSWGQSLSRCLMTAWTTRPAFEDWYRLPAGKSWSYPPVPGFAIRPLLRIRLGCSKESTNFRAFEKQLGSASRLSWLTGNRALSTMYLRLRH